MATLGPRPTESDPNVKERLKMTPELSSTALEEARKLIENHRAWTARAFCTATAELRGSLEPVQLLARATPRTVNRVALLRQRERT